MSSQPVDEGAFRPPVGPAASRVSPELAAQLSGQMKDLLDAVRAAEAEWRFDDRLDLAARLDPIGFGLIVRRRD